MGLKSVLTRSIRAGWHCVPKNKRVRLALGVLRRADACDQRSMGLASLGLSLSLLKQNGFVPDLVVDVGANHGAWTMEAREIFPSARYLLVDADPLNAPALEQMCTSLSRCSYWITLLGPEAREGVRFYQMGTGSSVMAERTSFNRSEITLPMTTLDALLSATLSRPMLLKLDVQGYELEVLRGGTQVLEKADVVIMECSLIQYNDGAPLFADVVAFMNHCGFVVCDFCGQSRRESDGVLFQTDVVFTRADSALRKPFAAWIPGSKR